jgi:pimeloyl-ACP methyl ester carboxylesterase
MKNFLRYLRNIFVFVAVVVGGVWAFGPREPIDTTVRFEADTLGVDLDAYLVEAESRVADLTDGTQKRIIWAGTPGAQSDLAFVYVHGWGASSQEIRPVPDKVAAHFGANLFYTRLSGHGQQANPLAMSAPSLNDWVQDMAEAMAIGRRIGKRVVLVTTSTGGSLAVMAAGMAEMNGNLAGIVLISPNFGPVDPLARLANWPLARYWVPALVGEWREWEPHNDLQGKYWTTRTQNVAALPMMALVKHVEGMALEKLQVPALFMYSEQDMVVSAILTAKAYERWGGPKQREIRVMTPQDSPSHHVITGDIMSPNQTGETVDIITAWVVGL